MRSAVHSGGQVGLSARVQLALWGMWDTHRAAQTDGEKLVSRTAPGAPWCVPCRAIIAGPSQVTCGNKNIRCPLRPSRYRRQPAAAPRFLLRTWPVSSPPLCWSHSPSVVLSVRSRAELGDRGSPAIQTSSRWSPVRRTLSDTLAPAADCGPLVIDMPASAYTFLSTFISCRTPRQPSDSFYRYSGSLVPPFPAQSPGHFFS